MNVRLLLFLAELRTDFNFPFDSDPFSLGDLLWLPLLELNRARNLLPSLAGPLDLVACLPGGATGELPWLLCPEGPMAGATAEGPTPLDS